MESASSKQSQPRRHSAPPVPPASDGRTSDADELAKRRLRAREERFRITNLDPARPVFSNFSVGSQSGMSYEVEVRDVASRQFSCTCTDFRINGLGTCKHVEAVLLQVSRRSREDVIESVGRVRSQLVRISPDVAPWLAARERERDRLLSRRAYEAGVADGSHPEHVTHSPLFTIANYEQVVQDSLNINARLRPDIVVLDEAQRIKNWSTKAAQAVKRLESRYAFVLTGTPIENRIDERGRPSACKNLDRLRERVCPILLRRRKAEVETELPDRSERNHFESLRSLAAKKRRAAKALLAEDLGDDARLLDQAADQADAEATAILSGKAGE